MHFASPGRCQGLDLALTWATLVLLIIIDSQQRFYHSSLRHCNRRKHVKGLKKPCCSQKLIRPPPHLARKKTPTNSSQIVLISRYQKIFKDRILAYLSGNTAKQRVPRDRRERRWCKTCSPSRSRPASGPPSHPRLTF